MACFTRHLTATEESYCRILTGRHHYSDMTRETNIA
jgi:hypothetical protein